MFYALAPFLVRRHWLILAGYIVATIVARRLLGTFEVPRSGFVYRFFPLELGLFLAESLAIAPLRFWTRGGHSGFRSRSR